MHKLAVMFGFGALVLKEKQVDPEGPLYVKLSGRQSGFWSYILNLFGISSTLTIEVYEDRIVHTKSSLSGFSSRIIPIAQLSDMECGFFKPILYLVAAGILTFLGLAAGFGGDSFIAFLFFIILAGICVLFFFLNKTTHVGFISSGAQASGILLKRSLIENQSLTQDEAVGIINIITTLIEKSHK